MLEQYGMARCNPTYTPVGKDLSTDRLEERLLSKEGQQRLRAIGENVKYLRQDTRYDMLFAVSQVARAMPHLSKAQMAVAKHLPR